MWLILIAATPTGSAGSKENQPTPSIIAAMIDLPHNQCSCPSRALAARRP
jgi:hypothetical protein